MSVLDHVNLHLVQSFSDAEAFMRWLGERRPVMGVDTETTGLRPDSDRIRLAQFGDVNEGWALPWERWSGLATEALKVYDGPLVLHNSKFDIRFITKHASEVEWPWHRTNDTMTMAHILNPLRAKGLKPLSAMLIDPKAAAAQRLLDDGMKDHKWDWASVPIDYPYYWIYAAMDPVLTCHLYEKFLPEITSSYKDVYDLELGVLRVVAKMERRGARVNLNYCETKLTELMTWVQEARVWLRESYGLQNATSNPQVLKLLDAQGIPYLEKFTNGGARSLDKEVLETIDHPIGTTILAIRKAEKNVGPYFSNFLEMADAEDRLHPTIWPMGTRTARMSITEPALQTLPRKDPTVRTAFIPSEGNVLVTCDYDQIEARLMAHFSKDEGLVQAFAGEDDFFCTIASGIFGEPIDKKDQRRQLTKNTVYGKLYGAGVAKMAQTAKVPFETMEAVQAGFDSRFPGVRAMQRQIDLAARQRASDGPPWISTPTGRRMYADDSKEYTLVNYLIQCHAAEILKRKLLELETVLPDDYMILPVHDEVVFDVPADEAIDVMNLVQSTMADHDSYLVPITASADILSSDWGEKYR